MRLWYSRDRDRAVVVTMHRMTDDERLSRGLTHAPDDDHLMTALNTLQAKLLPADVRLNSYTEAYFYRFRQRH
jgi:hypothetical protein